MCPARTVSRVNWTDTHDGHFCNVHQFDFKRGEVCSHCVTSPGSAIVVIPDVETLDAELRAQASEFRSLSRLLHRTGRNIVEDGTPRERADACKLIAEGTKLARLAGELEDRVASRQHDRFLCAHEERMAGLRGDH